MADSKYIIDVDDRSFDQEVLQRSTKVPVLMDFWAEWCAPCKSLTPVLTRLAEQYAGGFILAKVNTDQNQQLAMQCGVRSLPTVLLIKGGQIVDGFIGAQPESAVRALLQRHQVAPVEPAEETPLAAVATADRGEAIAQLRTALEKQPGDHRLHPQLAQLLIAEHRHDEAEEVLKQLPEDKQAGKEVAPLLVHIRFARALDGAPDASTLSQRLTQQSPDSETQYLLALRHALEGEHQAALDALLGLVQRDRQYGDDAARKAMVDVFTLLGGSGPLVKQYRSMLYSALN
ncbi:MAG: thioredoxin [Chromatiales bacterium]